MSERYRLTSAGGTVTLLQSLPEPKQKVEPPWAQQHFSYRFTGEPPVDVYDSSFIGEQQYDWIEETWNEIREPARRS